MSLLQVSGLHFSINGTTIISDFSLEIVEGGIVAILGESGSGKSTLLRLLAALEQPASGTLLLDGERIVPPAEKLIAGHEEIKLVKQDFGLFPNISLRENIAYELRFFEAAYREERVGKLLEMSGLGNIFDRLPREVSGGEQQRAVIARALADEPRLLLLDEPFSHLDLPNKQRLKSEILAMIREEKSGCIFVTHDVSDAFGIADNMIVIKNGKTLQAAPPTEIYECPGSGYTAHLTGLCNLLNGEQLASLTEGEVFPNNATYLVRPEWLVLAKSGFAGTIRSVTFAGHYYQYEITVDDLHGTCLHWLSFELFATGSTLRLRLGKYQKIPGGSGAP